MAFLTSELTTDAECDELVAYGQKKVQTATYQLQVVMHSHQNATQNATQYGDEIAGLSGTIASITTRLPNLAEGAYKKKLTNELRKATDRHDELVARQEEQGAVALIKREYEAQQAQAAIDRAQELITAVLARKAQL